MTITCFKGITTNHEILEVSNKLFEVVRLSVQRAIFSMNGLPGTTIPNNSIEESSYNFLKKYKLKNPVGFSKLAGIRRIGRGQPMPYLPHFPDPIILSKYNFESSKPILEQTQSKKMFDGLRFSPKTIANIEYAAATSKYKFPFRKEEYVGRILEAIELNEFIPLPEQSPSSDTPKAKELHLKLDRLKAIRRFGWEPTDWGSDDISCGGDGLDSIQQHIKAPSFYINKFNQDGEDYDINPDRTFIKFDLNKNGPWPRAFIANVFIVEKDSSKEWIKFLQDLWDAIGSRVVEIASTLAIAAAGGLVGAAIGTELMPIVGTVIGAIVGAVISMTVAWLLDSLKDDVFLTPDNPLGLLMPSQSSLFSGNKRTQIYKQEFNLGPARYIMSYYWELVY